MESGIGLAIFENTDAGRLAAIKLLKEANSISINNFELKCKATESLQFALMIPSVQPKSSEFHKSVQRPSNRQQLFMNKEHEFMPPQKSDISMISQSISNPKLFNDYESTFSNVSVKKSNSVISIFGMETHSDEDFLSNPDFNLSRDNTRASTAPSYSPYPPGYLEIEDQFTHLNKLSSDFESSSWGFAKNDNLSISSLSETLSDMILKSSSSN